MEIQIIGEIPKNDNLRTHLIDRVIPLKLCYEGEGAHKWRQLRRDAEYIPGEKLLRILREGLLKAKEFIGRDPINLVHIGPGDGIEIPYIFEAFQPDKDAKYAGVDISPQMLLNTFQFYSSYFTNINTLWIVTDVETDGNLELVCKDIKSKGVNRNLIITADQGVLLSNPKTLENLCRSMDSKDFLFITLEGDNHSRRKEICSVYNLPKVRDLLSVGLQRAGIRGGQFLPAKFSEARNQVEVYFETNDGRQILCLASYKPPSFEQFRTTLELKGLNPVFIDHFSEFHTYATLCIKGDPHV